MRQSFANHFNDFESFRLRSLAESRAADLVAKPAREAGRCCITSQPPLFEFINAFGATILPRTRVLIPAPFGVRNNAPANSSIAVDSCAVRLRYATGADAASVSEHGRKTWIWRGSKAAASSAGTAPTSCRRARSRQFRTRKDPSCASALFCRLVECARCYRGRPGKGARQETCDLSWLLRCFRGRPNRLGDSADRLAVTPIVA